MTKNFSADIQIESELLNRETIKYQSNRESVIINYFLGQNKTKIKNYYFYNKEISTLDLYKTLNVWEIFFCYYKSHKY